MIIQLQKTYYHYCEIGAPVVSDLETAPSMGQYYNQHIKGGSFDCRTHRMPSYNSMVPK